jgi:hypothetical protein
MLIIDVSEVKLLNVDNRLMRDGVIGTITHQRSSPFFILDRNVWLSTAPMNKNHIVVNPVSHWMRKNVSIVTMVTMSLIAPARSRWWNGSWLLLATVCCYGFLSLVVNYWTLSGRNFLGHFSPQRSRHAKISEKKQSKTARTVYMKHWSAVWGKDFVLRFAAVVYWRMEYLRLTWHDPSLKG